MMLFCQAKDCFYPSPRRDYQNTEMTCGISKTATITANIVAEVNQEMGELRTDFVLFYFDLLLRQGFSVFSWLS